MTILSSAYDPNFEQTCIDHGIHMPTDLGEEPQNWRELHAKLTVRRPSLSSSQFSDETFRGFCLTEKRAQNENDTIRESLPKILGEKPRGYHSAWNVLFGNLAAMFPKTFKKNQARPLLGSTTDADRPTSTTRPENPDCSVDKRQ
jgi:hypothetical protein